MFTKQTSNTRSTWLGYMLKIAMPILKNASQGTLRECLPLSKNEKNRNVALLEAIGRTVAGIAPWLELNQNELENDNERDLQAKLRTLTRQAMANAVDKNSKDYCVWNKTGEHLTPDQPIVDAAYFASAIIKAPNELFYNQPKNVQDNILNSFEKVLLMRPLRSNWLLFTATIEACKYKLTGICDLMRIDYAMLKFEEWHKGDGAYGDGEHFQWDYYNSFVIHPMLEEISMVLGEKIDEKLTKNIIPRIKRYSEIQERFIAPDGSFPFIGRSITYRMAAFQALAHCAYRKILPKTLTDGQVRNALDKVISKVMEAPTLFDENGFLTKGLYGKQEGLTNYYTNVGSLYICILAFLPLGLPAKDKFWTSCTEKTTWEKVWTGVDMPIDEGIF